MVLRNSRAESLWTSSWSKCKKKKTDQLPSAPPAPGSRPPEGGRLPRHLALKKKEPFFNLINPFPCPMLIWVKKLRLEKVLGIVLFTGRAMTIDRRPASLRCIPRLRLRSDAATSVGTNIPSTYAALGDDPSLYLSSRVPRPARQNRVPQHRILDIRIIRSGHAAHSACPNARNVRRCPISVT